MKTKKKDQSFRAYSKGYQAAVQDRSLSACPYGIDSNMAYHWARGWREGREDFWSGFNQQAFQQKVSSL